MPDTPATTTALEVAREYCSPALVNHSLRAYLFAAAYGDLHGIAYDAELLYVSSALHDIGLTPTFDAHSFDFEYAGGNVAWVFAAGAGWPRERRRRAAEIVIRHMLDVKPEDDP